MSMAPGSTVSCGLEGSACHPQRPAVPPAIWSPGLRNPREEARSSGLDSIPLTVQSLGPPSVFLSWPQIPPLYATCGVSADPADDLTRGQFLPQPLPTLASH